MKQLFSALALLVMSQVSMAHSTKVTEFRLQYSQTPKAITSAGISKSLRVMADGKVIYRVSKGIHHPHAGQAKLIATLSAHQMDRIENLIERARTGQIKKFLSGAMCFAPAMHNNLYNADNGRVFLESGDICDGGFMRNVSPAGLKLTQILGHLLSLAQTNTARLGDVELELN